MRCNPNIGDGGMTDQGCHKQEQKLGRRAMGEPNYIVELRRLFRQGELPVSGVAAVEVFHTDECGLFRMGRCGCECMIKLRREGGGKKS
jgi:hypothetical protein